MRQCEDEELMEVVLPHLAKVITLWEFLLMKVERGRPLRPHIGDIYRQYEQLHKQVEEDIYVMYCQTSNISCSFIGNKLVEHSDKAGDYIFILDLTPGFHGLGKDNCKTRRN